MEQLLNINKVISNKLHDDLKVELDQRKFTETCLNINQVLLEHNYFLKIYELKNKFREVQLKTTQEKFF